MRRGDLFPAEGKGEKDLIFTSKEDREVEGERGGRAFSLPREKRGREEKRKVIDTLFSHGGKERR